MAARHTPAMAALLTRYGVTTREALVRRIRDESPRDENGRLLTLASASDRLDEMLKEAQARDDAPIPTDIEITETTEHRDDGQCHDECWRIAVAEHEAANTTEDEMVTETINPIDALDNEDLDEAALDPRQDPRLNDDAFLATDEGQALLDAVAKADKEARKADRKAAAVERANAKAAKEAKADAALEEASPAIAEHVDADASKVVDLAAKRSRKPKAELSLDPATGATVATPKPARAPKPETPAKEARPTNRPMQFADETVVIKDVTYRVPLDAKGKPAPRYAADHWVWVCPTCKTRLRGEKCTGPEGQAHKAVKAPDGYRRESRVVASA